MRFIQLNPVVIYDAIAVILSVPSQPTWEDLFKILIKLYKLKESTETILVLTITRTNLNTFSKKKKDQTGLNELVLYEHISVKYVKKCLKEKLSKEKQISATEKVHRISYTRKNT